MTAADDLRALGDAATRLLNRCQGPEGHELLRRAAIPAGPDGYPRRASGGDPTSTGTRSPQIETHELPSGGHGWRCTQCGRGGRCATADDVLAHSQAHIDWEHPTGQAIDYADPTGETASTTSRQPDPIRALSNRYMRRLRDATQALQDAAGILDLAAQRPEPPKDDDPGCQSCARTTSAMTGKPRWEMTRTTTDVGGILKERQRLCRWCADATARLGRLPTSREVNDHHLGIHLRVKA